LLKFLSQLLGSKEKHVYIPSIAIWPWKTRTWWHSDVGQVRGWISPRHCS